MDQDRKQATAGAQQNSQLITAQLGDRAANGSPGPEQLSGKQQPACRNDHCANQPPVRKSIQIIIVNIGGLHLHCEGRRAVLGKSIVEMPRSNPQPGMVLPHAPRRLPDFTTRIHPLALDEPVFQPQPRQAEPCKKAPRRPGDPHQAQNRRPAEATLQQKHHKENHPHQHCGGPSAARTAHPDPHQQHPRSISQHDPGRMTQTAR